MSERDVERRLAETPLPGAEDAEERAWQVVSAVFDERAIAADRSGPARRYLRPALALALMAAVLAIALTPPGEAVANWIADIVDPGERPSRPALTSLPTGGRLLVTSNQGPWVVHRDGGKRRLGRYDGAAWSPNGLFVVATRGRQLAALEPSGAVRWALARPTRVNDPAWSPDGYRIAYISGARLRVVAGDGTGDAPIAHARAGTPLGWRPGTSHQLAYGDPFGRIVVVQADGGRQLWRSPARMAPEHLAWTPDGRRLISISRRGISLFSARGQRLGLIALPGAVRPTAAAVHPSGDRITVALQHDATGSSEVVAYPLAPGSQLARRLFVGRGGFDDLVWSPDGRWLLVTWPAADQWLFVRSTSVPKVRATSNLGAQFDPGGQRGEQFPEVSGWCCTSDSREP